VWRRAALWLCCVALAATADAQTTTAPQGIPPGPLTLDQVLQLAEPRSESIAIARTGVARATGQQAQARSALYPQLSLTAGYDRTLASEFNNLFTAPPASSSGSDSSFDASDLKDLPFGRENIWRATLSFSQNLYSGGRNGAQAALAATARESAQIGVTTARGQLLLQVTQAYYDAVLADQLVAIAQAALEQSDATLKQTQAAYDAGTQPEFELLRARVNRDNQAPLVIRQRVNRDVALQHLKQLLELPPDYDLRLADTLTSDTLPPPPVFASRVADIERTLSNEQPESVALPSNVPEPTRAVVTQAETTVRQREDSLALIRAQRMPSVSMNSSYGRVGYPSSFLPWTDFRTNWTVGASMSLPILTGGRQSADEAVARADLDQSRIQLQQTRELAALDTRSAVAELLASRAAWEATAGTVQQATRAYQIADVRYRSGVSTQLELSDSRLQLEQAQANRAQAARDLQVARARVALLPDLPLGTTGTPAAAPPPQAPQPTAPAQPSPASGGQIRNAAAQPAGSQFLPGTQQ
jgi:outer membrane protein TolC